MDMKMKKVFEAIENSRPQMVKTLSELISFPSFRAAPEEGAPFGRAARECLDRALEICKEFGFAIQNIDGYAGTASYDEKEPKLGILAHLDVVPAGDGWTKEPFKAITEDGLLFGRGAMDDKGPAVSVMYAMKALKDTGVELKNGVELIMGTDEECGSSDIAYFRKKEKLPEFLFTPDASYPLINIEKGHLNALFSAEARSRILLEMHGGKTVNAIPASASAIVKTAHEKVTEAVRKAGCSAAFTVTDGENGAVKISVEGKSAHASTPEMGDNALTALIKVLSLLELDSPAKERIDGLMNAFPYKETDGESAYLKSSDSISGALTLCFSILDYTDGKFSGAIDIRFPVCETVKSVGDRLGAALKGAGFEAEIRGSEPHCVPSDSPFIKELLSAYEAVTGKKGEPIAIGGGTYVHGMPGGVAFGCEVEGEDNRIHGADEFIRIDALIENAKIFAEAIVRVAGVSK